ncbi:MarC family protein [Asticcacaulis solisilvae]|uniref:MarC family protein n=1 Tax=Asticcacaulis solisilvae TaxID=1217274 RepID=UPI003FD72707
MELNRFIGLATLLYALANPIGIGPVFLALTGHGHSINRPKVVAIAAAAVALLLIASALVGQQLLAFFNVGLDDFRIAGGLLALFIAFEMFQARFGGISQTAEERSEAERDLHSVAITPLAFPLLIGPAEMSIMITLASDHPDWTQKTMLVAVALLTAAMIAATLLFASAINRLIGKTGVNIATRVMALFVAAIGINFIFTGIRSELPGLAS